MLDYLINTPELKLMTCTIQNVQEKIIMADMPIFIQQKISNYKHEEDRLQRLAGYFLLQEMITSYQLQHQLNLSHLQLQANHKPYFHYPFHFSIAHAKERIVCLASTKHLVGIDLEYIRAIDTNLLADYLTVEEQQFIQNSSQASRDFLSLWTKKEAIAKASGLGVLCPFQEMNALQNEIYFQEKKYTLQEITKDNYLISYAVLAS